MAPVFLVWAAAVSHAVVVNKAILYFLLPASRHIPGSTILTSFVRRKEEMEPACVDVRAYMLLWKCVFTCVWGLGWMSACGGKVVQPPPWLTSRLPSSTANSASPLLLTPAEADARFNTASMKQTQTPTVLLCVACSGCASRLVENPCLYPTIIQQIYKEKLRPTPEPLKTLLTTF